MVFGLATDRMDLVAAVKLVQNILHAKVYWNRRFRFWEGQS